MDKKTNQIEDDMSMTFVGEISQKSAVANESLEENQAQTTNLPNVEVDLSKDRETIQAKKQSKSDAEKNNEDKSLEPKQKKRNPILIIFLILICLSIGAFGSYYYFEVYNKSEETTSNKNEMQEQTEVEEEINPDGVLVRDLIARYDSYVLFDYEIAKILYSKDELSIKELDSNIVALLASKDACSKNGRIFANRFSNEEFHHSVVKLFGTDIAVKDQDIKDTLGGVIFTYDAETGYYQYKEPEGLGGATTYSFERKILKSEKDQDTLKVTVAIALLDSKDKKVYKRYNTDTTNEVLGTDEVEGLTTDTFSIDKDYEQLNQYQYTFNYDKENNNYILNRIELVK